MVGLRLTTENNQTKSNMARGGKRDGAGRPKGAATQRTREVADRAASEGLTPLDYMLSVLRDTNQPYERRDWAAEKAAPYVHARLASVEATGKDGGPLIVEVRRFATDPAE